MCMLKIYVMILASLPLSWVSYKSRSKLREKKKSDSNPGKGPRLATLSG